MSKRMNTVEEQVTPLQNKPSGRTSKKDENVVTLPPLSPENALIQQVTPLPNKPSGQTSKKDGNVVTLPLLSPKKALVHNTKILSTEETSSEEDEDSTRTTKSLHPERGVLCRIEGAKLSITVLIIRNLFEVDEEFLYFWVKALLNVWPKSVQLSATGESAIVKIPGTVDIGGLDLKDRCSRPEFLVRGERLFIYEDLPTADLQVVASATQSNTSIGEATLKSFFSSPQCVGLKNTPLMKSIYLKETHNGLPVHVITYATPQDVENVLQHGQSLSMDNWKFSVAEFYPQVGVCRQDSLVLYSDHHREYQDNQFSVLHISDVDEQKVDLKALKEYMANVNIAKGGDISSWRVTAGSNGLSSVQIIYTESDTAKRVFDFYLKQGRKVNDILLEIEHHTLDHTEHHDDYRLRISGLIGDIDPEKLKIYLSAISGSAVTQLVFNDSWTKAVAVFQDAIDYKKILYQSAHKPLRNQLQLQVHQDYKSTDLIAKGSNLKKDFLVSSLENILRNHFDHAVNVTAEEFPDATGVWKITTEHEATKQLLNNTEKLTCCESLEPYIEFLGRHVMTRGPAKTESLSNVVLEPLMRQFLTETPAAFQEISEFLQSIGMSLSFDGVISLNPSANQMNVRVMLKNWNSLKELLGKHISKTFSIYKTDVLTQEVHEKLLKKLPIILQKQSVLSNSRSCSVRSKPGYQISFVGETQLILQAKERVLQMIKGIGEEIKEKNSIQEMIVPNIFGYQIEYMEQIDYFVKMSRSHNLTSCSGEASKRTVTIKGHPTKVAAAQKEIIDCLYKITNSKASFFKTAPSLRVLNTYSAKKAITEMLSKEELKAVWMVENKTVSVFSGSKALSKKALSCMMKVVWKVEYPLDRVLQESEKKLLESDEWNTSKEAIMKQYEPLEIVEIDGQHRLKIIGVSDKQSVILDAITLFFRENVEQTISFKGVPDKMAFIKNYKSEIFEGLEREHCVAISPAQGDGIVQICGKAKNTANCQKSLREKHDSIYHAVHTIDDPLVMQHIHEDQDFLRNVGLRNNCLVVKQKEDAVGQFEIKNADKASCRCSVTLPNGTVCEVRKDDLPSVNCDAIVNAAHNHLAHKGGLARAIVEKGGDSIQEECAKFINQNGSLKTGQAFTSASGCLSCKKVIHAVGPKWSDGLNHEEDLLFKCIESCFEEADKHQVQSIAIPPVSTGIFCFPLSKAVKTIVSVVQTRDKQKKYLPRLVIFVDNKDDSLELFEKELTSCFQPLQSKSSPPKPRENVIQKGGKMTKFTINGNSMNILNRVNLEIKRGSIAESKENVLVNSVGSNFDLSHGQTSKAIFTKAGQELQDACSKFGSLQPGNVIETDGFQLNCHKVFHCCCPQYQPTSTVPLQSVKKIVQKCLDLASSCKYQSIAFPALGTGNLRYPKDDVAKAMIEAVLEYAEASPTSSIKDVKMVIFDQKTQKAFGDELKCLSETVAITPKRDPVPKQKTQIDSQQLTKRELKLSIYGWVEKDVNLCKMEIDKKLAECLCTVHWCDKPTYREDKKNIARLTEIQRKSLLAKARNLNVKLEVDKLRCDIKIVGVMAQLNLMTDYINRELQKINKDRYKEKEEAWKACTVQWKCKYARGKDWHNFNTDTNKDFERKYAANPKATHEWVIEDQKFKIDFSAMNGFNGSIPFRIARTERGKPQGLQDHWAVPLDDYSEHVIVEGTPEYIEVEKNFMVTVGPKQRDILEIKRVQNPTLYEQYAILRRSVAKKLDKPESEVEHSPLWHGTNENTVSLITSGKFDRGLAGKNATVWGCGCYFAKHASYSADDTYSEPNAEGHKYIIQTRVITGDYCIGNAKLKTAPYKQDEQFDSVVDNIDNPTKFIVFHDAAAYPEYVIKFK